MIRFALALSLLAAPALAGGLSVEKPAVPLAPPGALAHAAYFTLTNTGDATRQLIGVSANGYMMAHIHKTEVRDDIATMSSVDVLEIAPGQSVSFERGGLHVMLMKPASPLEDGGTVALKLEFANGETFPVAAKVIRMTGAGHSHGS